MKKKLITHKNLEEYLSDTTKEFVVDNSMILSPSVLDSLKEKGIKIVYKKNIVENIDRDKSEDDLLEEKIRSLLSKNYTSLDQDQIKEIVNKTIKKIGMEG